MKRSKKVKINNEPISLVPSPPPSPVSLKRKRPKLNKIANERSSNLKNAREELSKVHEIKTATKNKKEKEIETIEQMNINNQPSMNTRSKNKEKPKKIDSTEISGDEVDNSKFQKKTKYNEKLDDEWTENDEDFSLTRTEKRINSKNNKNVKKEDDQLSQSFKENNDKPIKKGRKKRENIAQKKEEEQIKGDERENNENEKLTFAFEREGMDNMEIEYPYWLKPENLKDEMGKRPDEEGYNPSTIYIPEKEFNSMSAVFRQFWDIKRKNFDKIILFR
jgi:hypothetical protein